MKTSSTDSLKARNGVRPPESLAIVPTMRTRTAQDMLPLDSPKSSLQPGDGEAEAFWNAVEQRDRAFDGKFVFSVASTGIYCRPSCPARTPDQLDMVHIG